MLLTNYLHAHIHTKPSMNTTLSRSKSAFFHHNPSSHTSTPSSRFNKPHPPLPNVLNTPDSPPPIPFTCPTPCALHNHSYHSSAGAGPPAPPSSSGTVRSARSVFFEARRVKKSKPIDDEETYCVLSEEGVEILAKSPEDDFDLTMNSRNDTTFSSIKKGSKALKRTPSLSDLLKTPSRLNLRKMPSKMKLFSETPSSVKSTANVVDASFSESTHAPQAQQAVSAHHTTTVNTPTSNKSSRSSKSFLRRAVFRDKTEKLLTKVQPPFQDASEHPLPGTVASRIKAMEETYRRSLIVESERTAAGGVEVTIETARSASVPLLNRPLDAIDESTNIGKTPRNKWLNKLHLGKSSSKRKPRLDIPSFEDSPSLAEKVENELKRRSLDENQLPPRGDPEITSRPTLRVQIEPPPEQEEIDRLSALYPSPVATPTYEGSPIIDRLSLAVSPQFIGVNQNHTFTFGTRSSSYFGDVTNLQHASLMPHQALVASSPLSGDLHISNSPARNGTDVVDRLNASFREREIAQDTHDGDVTGRFSIFSYEEKAKITNERPKSDPIPLKNIAQATNELRNLLESFEDTFAYDVASINTSIAPGTKHSYFASPAPPSRTFLPRKQEDEIPDDLQDLIDGVVQLNEVLRVSSGEFHKPDRPVSGVSSFEGNVTTAQDALRIVAENAHLGPNNADPAMATFEWVAAPSIHVENERISSDLDRRDSFSYSTSSARSSIDGFYHDQLVNLEPNGPRPSFDSGRSSFDESVEDRSYHERPKQQKYLSSCSGVSNRSSLRDYLAMERPGLGDRMLQEVDEDVALGSISDPHLLNPYRASFASTTSAQSNRDSYISNIEHFQTARTTNLPFRFSSASESDGTGSIAHSPTPANGLRRALNRHSLDCELGDLSRLSLDLSAPGHGTPSRRTSIDSHPSSPVSEMGRMANESVISELPSMSIARKSAALMATTSNAFVKQSTQSSLFSLSSVNSSPCPRPPRRKLLMLTGNRLPRAPPQAPVFAAAQRGKLAEIASPHSHGVAKLRPSMSPQQGRVRKLKDTWEAKLSPNKEQERSVTASASPRYVRPLPNGLESTADIARPQRLSSLSLTGAMSEFSKGAVQSRKTDFDETVQPDTPPPSSPSASEFSFVSNSQGSFENNRGGHLQGRLASFGRRRTKGHKRESSQLSRHSILAEAIQEEVTATLQLEPIQQQSPTAKEPVNEKEQEYSDYTQACEFLDSYLEDISPVASPPPKSVSPLVIRKTRSQSSLASERSLHLGLDAFQTKSQQFAKSKNSKKSTLQKPAEVVEIRREPVVIVGEDESHWQELEAHSQLKWTRFCHEAILELHKSRVKWPDTDVSLDIFESPLTSSNSSLGSSIYASPLIQAFSTPGSGFTPDLTSPEHKSAIVGFLLDSQARYRSELERFDTSLDVPDTPELSPDRSDMQVLQGHGTSEMRLPSPKYIKRLSYKPPQPKRTSYQPKSLMLVQKHLSNSSLGLLNSTSPAVKVEEKDVPSAAAPPPTAPLQEKVNQSALPKSTKGYRPRAGPSSPKKKTVVEIVKRAEPIVRPLTPGKRIRAVAKNRTMQVYADEVLAVGGDAEQEAGRQTINSFLPGRKMSQRRNDAFAAARRKLEGLGYANEQTDRSSGTSSTDEKELHKTGLSRFEARPSSILPPIAKTMGTVLEAGGSVEGDDTRSSGLFGVKTRPRPPTRRTASGLVRGMR